MLPRNGPLSLYELQSASRPQNSANVFAFVVTSIIYVYRTPSNLSYIVTKALPGNHIPTQQNKAPQV